VCLIWCRFLLAQEKEIVVSGNGITTNASKSDVNSELQHVNSSAQDSLSSRTPGISKHVHRTDSIRSLGQKISSQKVFSEKQWRQGYDTLSKMPGINKPPIPDFLKKEVSKDEMIDAVNAKFSQGARDSLSNSQLGADKDSLENKGRSLQNGVPSIASLPAIPNASIDPSKFDVSKISLPGQSLSELSPLPASHVKTKYLKSLDSIRQINIKKERLKLTEAKRDAQNQVSGFEKNPDFWDRSYFEGVIGFIPGDYTLLQFAPTLGFHFTEYLSLGLGPNVMVQLKEKKLLTTLGAKTFFKAEFLKRQAYFQLEDIMDSYGSRTSALEKRRFYEQHNVYAGGGFLLTMKLPVTLNLGMLYCITENKIVSHEFSPLVFRIGISALKKNEP
jgi:hypothetical protein